MPLDEGYIATEDGVRLFFQKTGSGAEVVLPNGFHLLEDFQILAEGRTLIFYDVRNRGRSDSIADGAKLARGILNDVDDLEAVRRHFGIGKLDLIAHSYIGVMAAAYAAKYPAQVNRLVQIGPMQPDASRQYPAAVDTTLTEVFSEIAELRKEKCDDPRDACEKFWKALRRIYVTDPADAARIRWGRCDLPNERNFMAYWAGQIFPSIQALLFSAEELAGVTAPVLVIHGTRDRSAPYGGGRDWAGLFPNGRLVTVEEAGHAPWIEAPEMVFGAIRRFLDGDMAC